MKTIQTAAFLKQINAKKEKKSEEWEYNPFAICNESVGTEKTPKRERCIQHLKKNKNKD